MVFQRRSTIRTVLLLGAMAVATGEASLLSAQQERERTPPGQQPSPCIEVKERPCVALVLSGGGARGGVHIGVLKVLEEMQVPVDLVVGTSMGAVVGGIYSAGYDVKELESALGAVDWNQMFAAKPPRRDRSVRRKEEDFTLSIGLELGMKGLSPTLPGGLLPDQNLNFLLHQLTLPVADAETFNHLPTPFRAATADVTTGDLVVLDRGSLADAIRASMALAGVFSPVRFEGLLLVDGAVALNFPVDIAVDLGADVIIAVEIASSVRTIDDFNSALAVTGQMNRILMGRSKSRSRSLLGPEDIYILPDPVGVTAAQFDKVMNTVPFGEEAAREHLDELAGLALPDDEWEEWLDARRVPDLGELIIGEIRVSGSKALAPETILSQISLREGDFLDAEVLRQDLGRIYGLGWFQRVGYRLGHEDDRLVLEIRLEDKPWGPYYLRSGFAIKDDLSGLSTYRLTFNVLTGPISRRGGDLRFNFTLGDPISISADVYQPLDYGRRYFSAAELVYSRFTSQPQFDRGDATLLARGDGLEARLGFGRNIGNSMEVRISPAYLGITGELATTESGTVDLDVEELAVVTSVIIDRFDNLLFPTKGTSLRAEWIVAREDDTVEGTFHRGLLALAWAGSLDRHTLQVRGEVGGSFGTDLPAYRWFSLGGLGRITGLGSRRDSGRYIGLGSVRYDYALARFPEYAPLRSVKLGGSLEAGNVWLQREQISLKGTLSSLSAFLAVDSMLGPVFFGYAVSSERENSWFLSVGGLW